MRLAPYFTCRLRILHTGAGVAYLALWRNSEGPVGHRKAEREHSLEKLQSGNIITAINIPIPTPLKVKLLRLTDSKVATATCKDVQGRRRTSSVPGQVRGSDPGLFP
jgi:hypothetical protein